MAIYDYDRHIIFQRVNKHCQWKMGANESNLQSWKWDFMMVEFLDWIQIMSKHEMRVETSNFNIIKNLLTKKSIGKIKSINFFSISILKSSFLPLTLIKPKKFFVYSITSFWQLHTENKNYKKKYLLNEIEIVIMMPIHLFQWKIF